MTLKARSRFRLAHRKIRKWIRGKRGEGGEQDSEEEPLTESSK